MGANDYSRFVAAKMAADPSTGFEPPTEMHPALFDYQRDVVRWALRRGRAAIFAGTGLGKTLMQLAWADAVAAHAGCRVLVLAPLAVATQTAREAHAFGIDGVEYMRADDGVTRVVVTNYEMLPRFNVAAFGGVVLDESSIIKHHDSKTRGAVIEAFAKMPFRLACTATPAPNDHTELGNHAEFLGVCTRTEMLSTFFCHDGGETQTWRLKGHARAEFWRWVASWAVMMRRPSDLGYDDGAHRLPPLTIHQHTVETDGSIAKAAGSLFASEARALDLQRAARKGTIAARVAVAAAVVAAEPDRAWLLWCDLNDESSALARAIPGAVEITGSDSPDDKEARIIGFAEGSIRVLVTKPSIAGFGVNWQRCARMVFVGVTHSWETYFQAIRRCWRFGQHDAVDVHVISSDAEGSVVASLERKEADAEEMAAQMVVAMADVSREAVRGMSRTTESYAPKKRVRVPAWMYSEEVPS
jgi:superfamily II DNA or RNA helicase